MPDPVTILATLAYVISKRAGSGTIAGTLSQLFGGAAAGAFRGDLEKLRSAFLTITLPDSNQDLDRAVARSSLHANLFCLMEALGEPLEPASGKLELWKRCVEERLPQGIPELGRQQGGFIAEADRAQLLQAKADCEADLKRIEESFTPILIPPKRMLTPVDDGYVERRAAEALALIEEKFGQLPDRNREIFRRKWFGYLCGSFQHEIKQNQPVSNILLNISVAELGDKIDRRSDEIVRRFDKTDQLILGVARPTLAPLNPFSSVPPLPTNFIDRPEISEPLRDRLLSTSGAVALTALEGMGGVGKTIVALGVCHDPKVRAAFPDGIVWLTVGKEANVSLEKRMKRVAHLLNHEFSAYSEESYRTLLSNKAVLVVLDDVWSLDAVEPFLMDPGRSRLLYTSRDRGLAGPLGAESYDVGFLDHEQSRNFLARWSGREQRSLPEPHASVILAELGGLALGLSMVGAALKGQPDRRWAFLVDDLRRAKLKQAGARVPGYHYETLHASIEVSVNALSQEQRDHYLQLAVLLEDMPAPPAALQALWGGNERSADDMASLLVTRSLASRDANGDIRLHDLQLDYIRSEHHDRAALDLEHAALLRSLHVVQPHPEQFSSQMIGRLLAHQSQPGIAAFIKGLNATALLPRMRPMWATLEAAGSGARLVLEGHLGLVTVAAVTPDGRYAVSGSHDCTLCIWDLEGKQQPRILKGHSDWVYAVAVTPDGRHAVSGSRDSTLRVWDLKGKQQPRILEGHSDWVYAVAVTPDGRYAVSGSRDRTARVWDLKGDHPPRVLEGCLGAIKTVAVTPDGHYAVSGSDDNTLRVWDLEGNQPPRVLLGHSDWVYAVAVTPDGRYAISGSYDNTLRIWDLKGKQQPRVLEGHSSRVYAVAVTPDGRHVVSGSRDRTLRVWDLEGNQPPRVLDGHTGGVYAVAVTPDGRYVVSGSSDRTLRVWDMEGEQQPRGPEDRLEWVRAVAVTPDGALAVSGSDDNMLCVWDMEGNHPPRFLEGHSNWVRAVAVTPDGALAVSGSDDYTLCVWDLKGNQPPRFLEGHSEWVRAVAVTPDGALAISGSYDNTLRVWDLKGNQPPRVLEGHSDWVRAVAVTPDGRYAVSGSDDNTLRVWDLEESQPPRVLEGHSDWVGAVAVTPDGRYAVSGSYDNTLRVWDLKENQPPRVLEGHSAGIQAVALAPDGRYAVSGSSDNSLRVWDLHDFRCLAAFTCDAPVWCCAWGGLRVVAGDQSGKVHLFAWEEEPAARR